jgi:multiple antibiotic resistance protein
LVRADKCSASINIAAGIAGRHLSSKDHFYGHRDELLPTKDLSAFALLLHNRLHTGMLEFATTVFITFLVIFDPVGMLPLFVALTHRRPKERRRRIATRSIAVAAITLVVVALVGHMVLRFLGIGLPAFRISGGLLLFLLSIDMVFARHSGIRSTTDAETEEAEDSTDVAIFPLAIPLIAGPGAMTSTILLMGRANGDFILQVVVIAVMLFALGLCLVAFLFAIRVVERLGVTGINVVGRVFGIVLAALAVQYVVDGVTDVLAGLPGRLHSWPLSTAPNSSAN